MYNLIERPSYGQKSDFGNWTVNIVVLTSDCDERAHIADKISHIILSTTMIRCFANQTRVIWNLKGFSHTQTFSSKFLYTQNN